MNISSPLTAFAITIGWMAAGYLAACAVTDVFKVIRLWMRLPRHRGIKSVHGELRDLISGFPRGAAAYVLENKEARVDLMVDRARFLDRVFRVTYRNVGKTNKPGVATVGSEVFISTPMKGTVVRNDYRIKFRYDDNGDYEVLKDPTPDLRLARIKDLWFGPNNACAVSTESELRELVTQLRDADADGYIYEG